MIKNTLKYLLAIGAIILIGLGALFFIQYLRDSEDPEKQAQKYMEALEKAYREDQYGGNTPEETLQLFIDALKKGDTDLAAKYFIIDEQEKWATYLMGLKNKDGLLMAITDVEKLRLSKKEEDRAFFTIANEKSVTEVQVILGKAPNGKWKIIDL